MIRPFPTDESLVVNDGESSGSSSMMFGGLGGGNVCMCNCVCPKVDGVYQCHRKARIYKPCKDLIPYLKKHQQEFVGKDGKSVAEEIRKNVERVHVTVLKKEEKIPGIKIVIGRRCIVRVDGEGKVLSAKSMADMDYDLE
eukprot:CAMPEP_0114511898 /NCGR_PEP_ID=MMETSP0109-20121206/14662_1 /TAXON_ID=29199 /ORGANISM="Chlorarachnion reptans, Strain CCCM449" /LENGTH=139 /DNA_ID=CAMNT_0001691495 /DNA_START=136 /DNA_END=555 /DNA_ORIENTATION=-